MSVRIMAEPGNRFMRPAPLFEATAERVQVCPVKRKLVRYIALNKQFLRAVLNIDSLIYMHLNWMQRRLACMIHLS